MPDSFDPTWDKFKEMLDRDKKSASEVIRIWIEGYVRRKDPSNPQRPLTYYAGDHIDNLLKSEDSYYNEVIKYAKKHKGEVNKKMLFQFLQEIDSTKIKIDTANKIVKRLKDEGVTYIE